MEMTLDLVSSLHKRGAFFHLFFTDHSTSVPTESVLVFLVSLKASGASNDISHRPIRAFRSFHPSPLRYLFLPILGHSLPRPTLPPSAIPLAVPLSLPRGVSLVIVVSLRQAVPASPKPQN
ncbi:hypothetical protein ACLOJK_027617 [Asimina triloba]